MASAWSVSGTYFEACNCEAICPCVTLSPPTDGDCTVLLAWHVDNGSFDGTDLAGLNVVLMGHSPGHMMQGQWKVALYLDQRASAAQQAALGKVFSGQAGGHLAALGPLIGEVLGAKPAAITYEARDKERHLRIDGIAQADLAELEGQGGAKVTLANHPFTAVPGEPAVVCKSTTMRYADYGLNVAVSGRNGFHSPFRYAGG
jgi:hypothetical protein